MMLKKRWVIGISLLFAVTFIAFRTSIDSDSVPGSQRQKLLAAIGQLLEEQHYSPQKIDDAFSKKVFK